MAGRLGTQGSEYNQHCEEAILGWEEVLVWSCTWVAAVELGLRVLESSRNCRVDDRW